MIELKFLGTGGLGSPRIKNKLSKDYRRFSTLMINDDLIIDPSEDIFEFAETFMVPELFDDIENILVTNTELDRLSTTAIEKLTEKKHPYVCAGGSVNRLLGNATGAKSLTVEPFAIIETKNYRIVPLPANHATELPGEISYSYLIICGETRILYSVGSAWINAEAWRFLQEITLDAVILDCALGNEPYSGKCASFNNLEMASAIREILISAGVASGDTKFILSNLPTGRKKPTHDEFCELIEKKELPFRVAYDGYFTRV